MCECVCAHVCVCACMHACMCVKDMSCCPCMSTDVHSVSQHEGSTEGGTELVIRGIGFDVDASEVEVDVDGIPCRLLGTNATVITCRTGNPPEGHLSIAGENYSYPHVQEGYRFKGDHAEAAHIDRCTHMYACIELCMRFTYIFCNLS